MSAKREDLEVMRCVGCNTVKAWRDGFPNRIYATCWECSWDRHVETAHGWQAWKARRRATRRARRMAIWGERAQATVQLRQDLITDVSKCRAREEGAS